jgi:hypothetical protein
MRRHYSVDIRFWNPYFSVNKLSLYHLSLRNSTGICDRPTIFGVDRRILTYSSSPNTNLIGLVNLFCVSGCASNSV